MIRYQPSSGRAFSRRSVLGWFGAAPLAGAVPRFGTPGKSGLEARIEQIIHRPEFENARWGMKFYAPDTNETIYSLLPDQPFTAGSAAKVFTEATVFSALGPDHRFHTKVYRTGPVTDGVVEGDLVLVAGGDLLIGGRIRPDGSVAAPSPDHTYGSEPPIPGDPLRVLRELAREVAAHGIRRVDGHVVVDDSLFRQVWKEIGTGGGPVPISPMMVNDNLIDVTVSPGSDVGAPAVLRPLPHARYLRILNDVRTIATADAPTARELEFVDDVANPDGTHTVRLTGEVPIGEDRYRAYFVRNPVRFAELAFSDVLRDTGIAVETDGPTPRTTPDTRHYVEPNLVAEHVSPPLSEAVKVMLKASSNLHAVAFPYLVGAIVGNGDNPTAVYETYRRRLLERAGVDPDVSDYSASYFTTFLSYMQRQPGFRKYRDALPIMGRDGSLADVQPDSPAAGHVFAKTGSGMAIGDNPASKALAGYIELPCGRRITFAQFMESASDPDLDAVGEAMGEVATAVYERLART